jgi:PAS domain S-box-containing protein
MDSLPAQIAEQAKIAIKAHPESVVTVLDEGGVFLYVSPLVGEMLGYAPEEIVGHFYADFYDADDAAHIELVVQDALLHGQSVEATRKVKLKSGGFRRTRGAASKLIDEDTGKVYLLSMSRPDDEVVPQ